MIRADQQQCVLKIAGCCWFDLERSYEALHHRERPRLQVLQYSLVDCVERRLVSNSAWMRRWVPSRPKGAAHTHATRGLLRYLAKHNILFHLYCGYVWNNKPRHRRPATEPCLLFRHVLCRPSAFRLGLVCFYFPFMKRPRYVFSTSFFARHASSYTSVWAAPGVQARLRMGG